MPAKEKIMVFSLRKLENVLRTASSEGGVLTDVKKPESGSYRNVGEMHLQKPPVTLETSKSNIMQKYKRYLVNAIKLNYEKLDRLKPNQVALVRVRVK